MRFILLIALFPINSFAYLELFAGVSLAPLKTPISGELSDGRESDVGYVDTSFYLEARSSFATSPLQFYLKYQLPDEKKVEFGLGPGVLKEEALTKSSPISLGISYSILESEKGNLQIELGTTISGPLDFNYTYTNDGGGGGNPAQTTTANLKFKDIASSYIIGLRQLYQLDSFVMAMGIEYKNLVYSSISNSPTQRVGQSLDLSQILITWQVGYDFLGKP